MASETIFEFHHPEDAEEVLLLGFNGDWDKGLPMQRKSASVSELILEITHSFEYKYKVRAKGNAVAAYEDCPNRTLTILMMGVRIVDHWGDPHQTAFEAQVSKSQHEGSGEKVEQETKKVEQEGEKTEREVTENNNQQEREKAESEARQKAEQEEKERAELQARKKADKEREETEKEAREKAEREVREKAEREAIEKSEREAREISERESKQKAEKEAKQKAEQGTIEKSEQEASLNHSNEDSSSPFGKKSLIVLLGVVGVTIAVAFFYKYKNK